MPIDGRPTLVAPDDDPYDDAEQRDDRCLVGGDAVEVTPFGSLFVLQTSQQTNKSLESQVPVGTGSLRSS